MPEPAIATPLAPAAAPKPSTQAPATPAPASAPPDDGDPFSSVDARIGKRPEPPKPPEGAKPAESKKEPTPAPSKEERTIKDAPKPLREELARTTAELTSLKTAKAELESKIAKFDSQGKDTTALTERLSAIERERDEARSEIRALKQEATPEFKDKWDKPFDQAANYSKTLIEQLQVGKWVQNEDTGQREWQPERTATWEDFRALYNMPAAKAAQQARAMFGDDASLVIERLNDLHLKDYQRTQALQEEKVKWKETETTQQADQVRRREEWKAAMAKAETALREKFPDRYGEDPEDKEGNELLKEGERLLNYQPKTLQEAAAVAARNKLNAVSAMRAFHLAAIRKERIAELEAELAELRDNGPGKTVRSTGGGGKVEKSWQEEMREAVPK